jgi:hypothetical protein
MAVLNRLEAQYRICGSLATHLGCSRSYGLDIGYML